MDKLEKEGWCLSQHGYNLVSDDGSITDLQRMIKRAIDMDLREIGSGEGDITQSNLVLQIQKLRNVAAPKSNEESRAAPRMLKFSLTDGKNNYQAVEVEHISGVSLNTPPGTKLLLKLENAITIHGIQLLRPSNIVRILGGKVPNLVEKWELNRKLATHSRLRSVEEGGPPPWIPFGKKIKGGVETEKNFKALGSNKDSLDKETTEFEAQRQDAIAEAARLGGKKVFGGGNKQLLDHSVQKIVDQGFSVEQAEYALKISRNNVDRALKSLQRTNESRGSGGGGSREPREPREPREQREPRTKRFDKKTEETKPSSGKVSLFDFLEDKLPAQGDAPETHGLQQQQQHTNDNYGNYRLENQFDRLELRGSEHPQQAGKGGRAQKGGRGYHASTRHVPEESRNQKRSSNNSYNPFPTNNSFGNTHQTKPPRFQRNQETHGVYQTDNAFKSHYGRSSQPNERKNNIFGQSRSEIGALPADSGNYANKSHREEYRRSGKGNQQIDRYQVQAVDSEPNKKQTANYDASHGRHNRVQHEGGHRAQVTPNATDKNCRNQSNKPHQSVTPEQVERESNNYGNNRNSSNNESAGGSWLWKVGDDCMAKYWEDNRYYNAQVTALSATTCVVLFKDFNNYEEVLQVDCIPITEKSQALPSSETEMRRIDQRGYGNRPARYDQSENHISGGMEFRRGGGGGGGSSGSKGYNRKRGQQRSAQPIYQPPPQRGHSSVNWNSREDPPL